RTGRSFRRKRSRPEPGAALAEPRERNTPCVYRHPDTGSGVCGRRAPIGKCPCRYGPPTNEKRPHRWGLLCEPLGDPGGHALSVAVNFPLSAFLNRASAAFTFISLRIAE